MTRTQNALRAGAATLLAGSLIFTSFQTFAQDFDWSDWGSVGTETISDGILEEAQAPSVSIIADTTIETSEDSFWMDISSFDQGGTLDGAFSVSGSVTEPQAQCGSASGGYFTLQELRNSPLSTFCIGQDNMISGASANSTLTEYNWACRGPNQAPAFCKAYLCAGLDTSERTSNNDHTGCLDVVGERPQRTSEPTRLPPPTRSNTPESVQDEEIVENSSWISEGSIPSMDTATEPAIEANTNMSWVQEPLESTDPWNPPIVENACEALHTPLSIWYNDMGTSIYNDLQLCLRNVDQPCRGGQCSIQYFLRQGCYQKERDAVAALDKTYCERWQSIKYLCPNTRSWCDM